MKKLLYITGLFFFFQLNGQLPIGSWTDHLRYNTAKEIALSNNEVYASTGTSIIVYNKEFSELKKLSPVNGLSETGISAIAWSSVEEALVIAYHSADIDLVIKNTVYNIPDISNKFLSSGITINRVRTSGKFAYLAANFGIIVVNLEKKEIYDTWKPGPDANDNEVFDITFGNDMIYAATESGVWYGKLSNQGLAYFGNWNRVEELPYPGSRCTLVIFAGNRLYINVPQTSPAGDLVYSAGNGSQLFSSEPGTHNNSFDLSPSGFSISSQNLIRSFNSDGTLINSITSYGWGTPDIAQGIIEADNIWIADLNYGLIKGDKTAQYVNLSIPGPSTNSVANITSRDGVTIISAGGTDNSWNGFKRPFRVSVHNNNVFTSFVYPEAADAMRSCFDSDNSSHFFVSSWGNGLYEFTGKTLSKHYDGTNTPLLGVNAGSSGINICGMAMDLSKNLWITQTGTGASVKILKPDGVWIVYPAAVNAPVIGDIIAAGNGLKWIILPKGNGLYIIDDNNTPGEFSDDNVKKLTVKDSDGTIFSNIFSIAEDLDGNVWVGTDKGPVIYYNSTRIFDNDATAYRIKIPRNDGTGLADYMLGSETITSIAVDGANRKWLGTSQSGAYLLSADGTTKIRNYNTLNSPVFSDSLASVAVDNSTGEVWFGSSKGTLSVRETAIAGKEKFTGVYSFPNPVRRSFTGNVTITGLIRDTQVKITDISGNLVYETFSEGGQAQWDLTTYNGRRVTAGVYLVFCSSGDGSESCVTKILVAGQ